MNYRRVPGGKAVAGRSMAESAARSKVRGGIPRARAPQADGRLPMVRGTHFNRVIFTDTLRPISV